MIQVATLKREDRDRLLFDAAFWRAALTLNEDSPLQQLLGIVLPLVVHGRFSALEGAIAAGLPRCDFGGRLLTQIATALGKADQAETLLEAGRVVLGGWIDCLGRDDQGMVDAWGWQELGRVANDCLERNDVVALGVVSLLLERGLDYQVCLTNDGADRIYSQLQKLGNGMQSAWIINSLRTLLPFSPEEEPRLCSSMLCANDPNGVRLAAALGRIEPAGWSNACRFYEFLCSRGPVLTTALSNDLALVLAAPVDAESALRVTAMLAGGVPVPAALVASAEKAIAVRRNKRGARVESPLLTQAVVILEDASALRAVTGWRTAGLAIDVGTDRRDWDTPLRAAAYRGSLRTTAALVAWGADPTLARPRPNKPDPRFLSTPVEMIDRAAAGSSEWRPVQAQVRALLARRAAAAALDPVTNSSVAP